MSFHTSLDQSWLFHSYFYLHLKNGNIIWILCDDIFINIVLSACLNDICALMSNLHEGMAIHCHMAILSILAHTTGWMRLPAVLLNKSLKKWPITNTVNSFNPAFLIIWYLKKVVPGLEIPTLVTADTHVDSVTLAWVTWTLWSPQSHSFGFKSSKCEYMQYC